MQPELELGVSDFVALLNQTLDYAYSGVIITGELANLRVSKGKWLYFDLKDDESIVKFFGTVYMLPGPLEDGMILKVRGQPRLYNLYGFSVNVQSIQPAGEGTIRRAAELLQAKLASEGLFGVERKRPLPYPPTNIGLIASKQSAAYADFIKILDARWSGVVVQHIDVQVQGEQAPPQIIAAIEQFNAQPEPPEVLVIIRGGGSAEDLSAFSSEQLTRTVAASRVPTLVAIGHETDLSLAELAADLRASTPSNAAELLVPERQQAIANMKAKIEQLTQASQRLHIAAEQALAARRSVLQERVLQAVNSNAFRLQGQSQLLEALSPDAILRRGYAVVRRQGKAVRLAKQLSPSDIVVVQVAHGSFDAAVRTINKEHA